MKLFKILQPSEPLGSSAGQALHKCPVYCLEFGVEFSEGWHTPLKGRNVLSVITPDIYPPGE